MRALLDVNVLIALLDLEHSLHERAMAWLQRNATQGWASCPLTQNGCLRIMSHSSYPQAQPVAAIARRLAHACNTALHQFWPDDLSLLDPAVVDYQRVHSSRELTDLYLLALAVKRAGMLVTFDHAISLEAIRGAEPHHLLRL